MPAIKLATMKSMEFRMPWLLSETGISISLLCQLYSTRYTAVRVKNCLKSTSVIKVDTMKNMDDFCYAGKGRHHVHPPNQRFSLSSQIGGTQRRALVSP